MRSNMLVVLGTLRYRPVVLLVDGLLRPGPTPPPPPPPPPLPPAKYKVELVEHNALPALSHGNPTGKGGSPCKNTFNPSYVEIAGKNKVI